MFGFANALLLALFAAAGVDLVLALRRKAVEQLFTVPHYLFGDWGGEVREFINMCDTVSTAAFLWSPKRESTVHTLMPRGITLSVPNESAAFRLRLFTEPSGFIWLKRSLSSISICADRHIGTDNRNARSPNNFLVVLIIAVIIGVLI